MMWRRQWQPTPVFLAGESQGRGSLVGCHLWGRTESDTTEATWRRQQQGIAGMANICPSLPHSPTLFLVRTPVFLDGAPLWAYDQFLPGQCPGGLRPQPSRLESCPTGDRFSLFSRLANMDDRSLVICAMLSLPHFREEKAAWRRSREVATVDGAEPQLC